MADRLCSIDECERVHYGRGYCQMHYSRWRTHGDPLLGAAVRNPDQCIVDACEKKPQAKGMCPMHYQRVRLYGSIDPSFPPPRPRPRRTGIEPCEIDGCEKPIIARGWCTAHWTRWKRHGSPVAQVRGEVANGKRVCCDCKEAVAVEDWYVTPAGKFIKCRECFGEWNRNNVHRRRAVTSGPPFTRRQVLERDGWVCQLCSEAIDPELKHPDPLSATLDHIVPLARGGEHSLENAQAAHRICNNRKWANLVEVAA